MAVCGRGGVTYLIHREWIATRSPPKWGSSHLRPKGGLVALRIIACKSFAARVSAISSRQKIGSSRCNRSSSLDCVLSFVPVREMFVAQMPNVTVKTR